MNEHDIEKEYNMSEQTKKLEEQLGKRDTKPPRYSNDLATIDDIRNLLEITRMLAEQIELVRADLQAQVNTLVGVAVAQSKEKSNLDELHEIALGGERDV